MTAPTVVIGGGAAGMSTAAALARHGRRVVLVERARRLGPLLRRFRRGSSWCGGGFHYSGGLERGGSLEVIFRYLGARAALRPIAMKPEGFERLITPRGRELRIPNGLERVGEALSEAFPASRAAVSAYIGEVGRVLETTPFLNFDMGPEELLHGRKRSGQSLAGLLAGAGAQRELIDTLGHYGLAICGSGAETIPIDFHAMVTGSLYRSAHTLRGGGDDIVGALEAGLARQGVEVRCGQGAVRIHTAGRRVTGVELEGGELIPCAEAVATINPKLLPGMLGEGTSPGLQARIAPLENTFGLFGLFMEIDEPPASICGSNIYRFFEKNGDNGENELFMAVLSCNPPETPGGKASFMTIMPSRWDAAGEPGGYEEYKGRETGRVSARLFETLPELRGKCRLIEAVTPRSYAMATGTPGGAAYGIRQSVGQKDLNATTGIGGLYLAGQSVLVAGVLGAVISGLIAAANIVGIEAIWAAVQRHR